MQGYWHLGNFQSVQTRLDYHFGSELHAGATQVEPIAEVLGKPTEPAVNIIDRSTKPYAGNAREDRVSQPSMRVRHGVGHDPSPSRREATPLHQVIPFTQLLNK